MLIGGDDISNDVNTPFPHNLSGFSGKDAPTVGVGTCTYASPEQLRNTNYDNKVKNDPLIFAFYNKL